MRYSEKQAAEKAKQIFGRFGGLIGEACRGSIVPEGFLGGFCGVEAGVDHGGHINPDATRFEPGVYHHLLSVQDGLLPAYNHIHRSDLVGLEDLAIRNLATSWGLTQIMGWHMIHDLVGTIADLRDLDQHLHYTVQLLVIDAKTYLAREDFASVLRIWNSGSANGRTYDPDYVPNALAVKHQYELLLEAAKDSATEQPAVDPQDIPSSGNVKGESSTTANTPPDQAPPPSGKGSLEKLDDLVNRLGEPFDQVTKIGNDINTRKDAAKSLWTTILHTVFQAAWALIGFLIGLPKEIWIGVAVIVAIGGLYYLYRQIELGKIREKASSTP